MTKGILTKGVKPESVSDALQRQLDELAVAAANKTGQRGADFLQVLDERLLLRSELDRKEASHFLRSKHLEPSITQLSQAVATTLDAQLLRLKPEDIKEMIGIFPEKDQQKVRTTLALASNFASFDSLAKIAEAVSNPLYVPREVSTAESLRYLVNYKKLFRSSLDTIQEIKEDSRTVIFDSSLCEQIVKGEVDIAKIADANTELIVPLGFETGVGAFHSVLPSEIITRVAEIMFKAQEKVDKNPKLDWEDAVKQVLLQPYQRFLEDLDKSLPEDQRGVLAAKLTVIENPFNDTSDESLAVRLNGPQQITKDTIEDVLSKLPDDYRFLAARMLVEHGDAFSVRRLSNDIEALYRKIETHAARKGILPEDIKFYIPEFSKSYVLIAQIAANRLGLRHSQLITKKEKLKSLDPKTSMVVIFDDVAGSGASLSSAVQGVTSNFNGATVVAPICATKSALAKLRRDYSTDSITTIPGKVLTDLKEGPLHKELNDTQRQMLARVIGGAGYSGNQLNLSFPYMSPDNSNGFWSNYVAPLITHAAAAIKKSERPQPTAGEFLDKAVSQINHAMSEYARIKAEHQDDPGSMPLKELCQVGNKLRASVNLLISCGKQPSEEVVKTRRILERQILRSGSNLVDLIRTKVKTNNEITGIISEIDELQSYLKEISGNRSVELRRELSQLQLRAEAATIENAVSRIRKIQFSEISFEEVQKSILDLTEVLDETLKAPLSERGKAALRREIVSPLASVMQKISRGNLEAAIERKILDVPLDSDEVTNAATSLLELGQALDKLHNKIISGLPELSKGKGLEENLGSVRYTLLGAREALEKRKAIYDLTVNKEISVDGYVREASTFLGSSLIDHEKLPASINASIINSVEQFMSQFKEVAAAEKEFAATGQGWADLSLKRSIVLSPVRFFREHATEFDLTLDSVLQVRAQKNFLYAKEIIFNTYLEQGEKLEAAEAIEIYKKIFKAIERRAKSDTVNTQEIENLKLIAVGLQGHLLNPERLAQALAASPEEYKEEIINAKKIVLYQEALITSIGVNDNLKLDLLKFEEYEEKLTAIWLIEHEILHGKERKSRLNRELDLERSAARLDITTYRHPVLGQEKDPVPQGALAGIKETIDEMFQWLNPNVIPESDKPNSQKLIEKYVHKNKAPPSLVLEEHSLSSESILQDTDLLYGGTAHLVIEMLKEPAAHKQPLPLESIKELDNLFIKNLSGLLDNAHYPSKQFLKIDDRKNYFENTNQNEVRETANRLIFQSFQQIQEKLIPLLVEIESLGETYQKISQTVRERAVEAILSKVDLLSQSKFEALDPRLIGTLPDAVFGTHILIGEILQKFTPILPTHIKITLSNIHATGAKALDAAVENINTELEQLLNEPDSDKLRSQLTGFLNQISPFINNTELSRHVRDTINPKLIANNIDILVDRILNSDPSPTQEYKSSLLKDLINTLGAGNISPDTRTRLRGAVVDLASSEALSLIDVISSGIDGNVASKEWIKKIREELGLLK